MTFLNLLPLTGVLLFLQSIGFSQPSFNCENAQTASEKLICTDSHLASEELQMSNHYKDVSQQLLPEQKAAFHREQQEWFAGYARACNSSLLSENERKDCIDNRLTNRIRQMQTRIGPTFSGPEHPVAKACALDGFIAGLATIGAAFILDAVIGVPVATSLAVKTVAGVTVTACLSGGMKEMIKQPPQPKPVQ